VNQRGIDAFIAQELAHLLERLQLLGDGRRIENF
jgi:hypothetical protein